MARSLMINGRLIDDDSPCYVIAEFGHNHQGELEKAEAIIKEAKWCGCHAVKTQKRDNRRLYTKAFFEKQYQNENSYADTYGKHREHLEFGETEYRSLKGFCETEDITFFATAFDPWSADMLAELDMPAYKIASGDLRTIPLLKHVARIGKPMILSTGGGSMDDIRRAHDAIMPINPQLAILQCTASYPTEAKDVNLRVIQTLREEFPDNVIGFSDHYNGIAMATAAYIMGARIIEKHFTLNHTWKGTDHALSLEPVGMRKMVRDLDRIREGFGDGIKEPLEVEQRAIQKMGKSLVAARDLPEGHVLSESDIAYKSPGKLGAEPYELETFIGRSLDRALQEDAPITVDIVRAGS